ncbi:hypothetical protein M7I_3862 [Glarea lozoyensis 74030]|uniref:Uncharacterized protein n=1 Tax=Glarea lozoyensis (strain ATCC 74030 / MF5533) TaxID=1104152 RepID=H0EMM3_GLAL7|nr:hypothetical protein M7I_3862 [Glarea lozoyensis 74030]
MIENEREMFGVEIYFFGVFFRIYYNSDCEIWVNGVFEVD